MRRMFEADCPVSPDIQSASLPEVPEIGGEIRNDMQGACYQGIQTETEGFGET